MKKIIHISDIHIRYGDKIACRYDEYIIVFENLLISIKEKIKINKLKYKDFVIIITGDIFHNKNVIGNYGLELYNMLITGLSKIGHTIIFHGNHDRNQNEISQPSLISSTIETANLTILKETQSFVIDNVGFSYVSIDDTLDTLSTVGRIKKLPPFPIIKEDIDIKIALFHGTFACAKLYNGTEIPESSECTTSYPFSWISDFDYALLGDIHLRQQGICKKVLWGYSGSLVQQNYGEDIIDHGYMIWDLETRTIENVNVYNPFGYINIIIKNNDIYLRKNGKYFETLEDFISENTKYFPEKTEIRSFSSFTHKNTKHLYDILNKYNKSCSIISNKILPKEENVISNTTNDSDDLIHVNKETFIEYLNKYIPPKYYNKASDIIKNLNVLLFNIDNCPNDLIDECVKKNKEISTLINICNLNDNVNKNKKYPFTIEYLEWENLYCYEGGNSINFAEAINNTLLIRGNNGTGKSAIYDIITLAIWGVITKDKQNTLSKNGIINYKHKNAYTIIDISVNGDKYQIKRKFAVQSETKSSNKNNIEIYKYENGVKSLIKKNNACNEFIKSNFNTVDDFLTCSMITQVVDNDILRMDYKECTAIIDKASNINEIYELFNLFKVCLNKYKDFNKTIDSKKQVYQHIIASSDVNDDNIDELINELSILEENYKKLMILNNSIAIDIDDNKYIDSVKLNHNLVKQISDEEYNVIIIRFNELKEYFKNIEYKSIEEYASKYSDDIDIQEKIEKPCEYSIIKEEKMFLSKYNKPIIVPINKIDDVEIEYKKILEIIKKLNDDKPTFEEDDVRDMKEIVNDIIKIFSDNNYIELLKEFILVNLIQYNNNKKCHNIISHESYKELLIIKEELKKSIDIEQDCISECDNKLEKLYISRNELIIYNKPNNVDIGIDKSYKYDNIKENIIEYEKILNVYYLSLEEIDKLNIILNNYKNELNTLKNNEEYGFDPCCKYCCGRSWVIRMKELEIIIKNYNIEIDNKYYNIYERKDIDYIEIYEKYNILKEKSIIYDLHVEWNIYNKYIDEDTYISNDISKNVEKKKKIIELISISKERLLEITHSIDNFNIHIHMLNKEYNNRIRYDKYVFWKKKYDDTNVLKNKIEIELSVSKNYNEYVTYIKPRICNLSILGNNYNKWKEYDTNIRITNAYKYMNIFNVVNLQELYYEYEKNKNIKDTIFKKRSVLENIDKCSSDIKMISNKITKMRTLKEYNLTNINNYEYYLKESVKLSETIDILSLIIDNFKTYKIDLYENHILKKLMIKTNSYIKLLCHENTKGFKLDFLISEQKDIIHINWLIHNISTDDKIKQVISINQASGFQKFVISLALRMSLYSNTQTEQLFIDEGFTACDNQNLSLVPEFLKKLLNTFSCIIIVSHIDVIKDSADIIVNIEYNKDTKTSYIKL